MHINPSNESSAKSSVRMFFLTNKINRLKIDDNIKKINTKNEVVEKGKMPFYKIVIKT